MTILKTRSIPIPLGVPRVAQFTALALESFCIRTAGRTIRHKYLATFNGTDTLWNFSFQPGSPQV